MEAARTWGRGIEWEAVRALLAREAVTPMGRERALTAEPLTEVARVRAALDFTGQARRAVAAAGAPPLEAIPDVRPVLEAVRADGSLVDGAQLVLLVPLLETSPRLVAYGRGVRPAAPAVAAATDALPQLHDLLAALRRALDDDGTLTDQASPRLARVRRDIRESRRRIVSELERLLNTGESDRIFAERFVTVRHGRYVLPVRADARSRVRGIVHDRSGSGQTLFIEPERIVDANNDLVDLVRQEEQEAARILAELSAAVREHQGELGALIDGIAELDWVFVRAQVAERMDATAPIVDAERTVTLRGARHPLLLAQSWQAPDRPVVPVDIELTSDRPLLIITGPNAGGKTITLKTLALLALMAQVGCHVPATEGARLPVFDALYAIIGDDQSVAENLSTFSAFVKQVREILTDADDRSLVLLDELGAGTDPDEGAALAQAILEALEASGALVVATTHLEPLKAFASTHSGARNGSVEFDTATLSPTFRLLYDRPGQSYALAIAARLGLPPELIARAREHRSALAARLADLVARLDTQARTEAERTLALERREAEATERLATARETEARAAARAQEVLERAKAEAAALLRDTRRAIASERDKLKRGEHSRESLQASYRRLSDLTPRVTPAPDAPAPAEAVALAPGSRVTAEHLGLKGEIVSIAGATATVRAGAVTVRVPLQALRPAPDVAAGPARAVSTIRVPEKSEVAPELHLLGRTTDEARDLVERYLDDAFLAGLGTVRVVHGKGTGALRKAVRDLLAAHPLVDSYRDGQPSEGGAGATVAALKVG